MKSDAILAHLAAHGVLLIQDKKLPSVVSMVAGGPISGSWWGHAQNHQIYDILTEVEAHPDVVVVTLVDGKKTLVHRKLWSALYSVAVSREQWQTQGLSRAGLELLARLDQEHRVQAERRDQSTAAKELELRLLAFGHGEHTPAGHHARVVTSWRHWRQGRSITEMQVAAAKLTLEQAATTLGGGSLPWQSPRPKKKKR
jgi:hypothetical protein